mmetsp:Transcript_120836/g.353033  ORF Transcript_120836/g.353033 Transcript_120836/m.353033 type:complete len:286 (+) Transcript_120836:78-935(+)
MHSFAATEDQVIDYLSSLPDDEAESLLARIRARAAASRGEEAITDVDAAATAGSCPAPPSALARHPETVSCRVTRCTKPGCCARANSDGFLAGSACEPASPSRAVDEATTQPPSEAVASDAGDQTASVALMRAIGAGNWALARTLADRADLCHLGEDGWSGLHWAVHAAGASLQQGRKQPESHFDCASSCCSGNTPGSESRPFLREVVDKRSSPQVINVKSADGATPLMFAADAGDAEVCELLLTARADPALRDDDGDTAATWARNRHHMDLAAHLASLEANVVL